MSSQPFLLRIALGDIVDVAASMVVVGHINDVAPSGAEAALDALLGGAISRHVGPRRSHLGTSHLLPALTSALPSPCVAVVSMGDAEEVELSRLPELGAAIAEAASAAGVRDAATVLIGAGSLDLPLSEVAAALLQGLLSRVERQPATSRLRELTIVERDEDRRAQIGQAIAAVRTSLDVHVYLEEVSVRRTVVGVTSTPSAVVEHVRLGITRSGDQLKVTTIGDGAFDVAKLYPFPAHLAQVIATRLHDEVLQEGNDDSRDRAMKDIGSQLYQAFLAEADVLDRLLASPEEFVVLRLDESTVDLPWELLDLGQQQLALAMRFSRQVEFQTPARQAAYPPSGGSPSVLVIGNPTGDLPAAQGEAEAVASALAQRSNADVELIHGGDRPLTYRDLSTKLNERAWDIVHYAGHASFDPLRDNAAGLELADSAIFTAQDLTSRRYLPRLFVANACYSGTTGDARLPDAVRRLDVGSRATRSLVTGVLSGGARGFVGAAWQVDDRAAATFAAALYEELLTAEPAPRGTLGQAVRQGRRAVLRSHGPGESTWAAYVLYGSPWKRAF